MSTSYHALPVVRRLQDAPCGAFPSLEAAKDFARRESCQRTIVYRVWQISSGPSVRLITVFRNGKEVMSEQWSAS
jgi:hypothetical protein